MSMRGCRETNVGEQLRSWLVEEAYKVTVEDTPKARFNLLTELPGTEMLVNVAQPISSKDRVDVSAHLALPLEYLQKLQKLPDKSRADFLYDLSFSLLANNVPFQFVPNLVSPTGIVISIPIWYDGLSKDRLLTTLQKVLNMILLVMAKFQQKLGVSTPETIQMR